MRLLSAQDPTVALAETDGQGLPDVVTRAFERYVACGQLADGCSRLRCGASRSLFTTLNGSQGLAFCYTPVLTWFARCLSFRTTLEAP